ncbi:MULTISPECIES: triose-phosphate isomerase [Gulbenkiania]|uniref:Triosephosphate isomerase n=1 Tax=Gulbenkiania indica TaxID=375574 RepID=A0A0K6H7Z7_9NEIS|nr:MULTISPECIES: triose-phosphate isomerase [Gulbenkiania]CUA86970.1 triosephosphate isomerase [Gulbenkiania indica]
MKNKIVMANWKMHGRRAFAAELVGQMRADTVINRPEVCLAVPMVYLDEVGRLLAGSAIGLAAQDVSARVTDGAYTGEVSAAMLADVHCTSVLIGHSERRQYHGEDGPVLRAKVEAASTAGLSVVYCIGETLEQREQGGCESVLAGQLDILQGLDMSRLVVAYEPVWAIGTGRVATLDQIREAHAFIRHYCLQTLKAPDSIRVLYGGSVKPDNAGEILALDEVDGALVGGASLDYAAFRKICEAA